MTLFSQRSVFIIPNEAVRVSNSIGLDSESDLTLFSTSKEVINATTRQFNQMLSLCRPAINVFRAYEESKDSFFEFFTKMGNQISLSRVLPPTSIPKEIFEQILENKNLENGFVEEINFFLNKIDFFEDYLNEHKIVYMAKLPDIDDIIEEKVAIASPVKLYNDLSNFDQNNAIVGNAPKNIRSCLLATTPLIDTTELSRPTE